MSGLDFPCAIESSTSGVQRRLHRPRLRHGRATLFGFIVLQKSTPPFFMPMLLPVLTLGIILFICALAAALGLRKTRQLEPAVVLRG